MGLFKFWNCLKSFVKDYAHTYIKGIDINPDLAKVAKMHMVLYDDGHMGIFAGNSLEDFDKLNDTSLKAKSGELKPEFKVLMTNPPFGTKGKVTDKTILRQFELGYKWKKDTKTGKWEKTNELQNGQVPDILFIERCLQFLDNGGRIAIVLPDGNLTNSSLEYIREFIRSKARILGVVSLPQETFVPHGAGSKTSLLFLQKLSEEELEELKKEDYPIFIGICEKIGYDIRGRTLFKKDERGELIRDENGQLMVDWDIPGIIGAFERFEEEHGLNF